MKKHINLPITKTTHIFSRTDSIVRDGYSAEGHIALHSSVLHRPGTLLGTADKSGQVFFPRNFRYVAGHVLV